MRNSKRYAVTPEIAELLRSAMSERGMSQRDIAKRASLTDATVSDVLNCQVGSSKDLLKIADALDVPRFRVLMDLEDDQRALLESWQALTTEDVDPATRGRLLAELQHRIAAEVALSRALSGQAQGDGEKK